VFSRLSLTALAMCVVAAAGCAKAGMGHDVEAAAPQDRPIFVHLYMSGNDCVPVAGVEPIPMGRGDRVVWEIRNDCTDRDTYLVKMENFKESNGHPNNPGENPDPKRRVPKGESATLTTKIKPNAKLDRYKYDIALENGKRQDPELEVEY
jgi:hypothetical protein